METWKAIQDAQRPRGQTQGALGEPGRPLRCSGPSSPGPLLWRGHSGGGFGSPVTGVAGQSKEVLVEALDGLLLQHIVYASAAVQPAQALGRWLRLRTGPAFTSCKVTLPVPYLKVCETLVLLERESYEKTNMFQILPLHSQEASYKYRAFVRKEIHEFSGSHK